jgi:YfiH family protein
MTVDITTAKSLDGIAHGFCGRKGGVSEGIYASLNIALGSKDVRDLVLENRRRAVEAVLPGSGLARVYQIHSADVVTITASNNQDDPPKGDAMVTNVPGILLGISTADCVPVLFADMQARVVGAAHSGWKGSISGVNEATLSAMEALGADRSRIVCAIGPCIAQKSYEVDEAFFRRFADDDPANERFFGSGKAGHHQFDIEGYVASRLAAAGVSRIECLGEDTYSQPDRFFSYRRTCHLGEPDYGAQISLIGLRP